MVAADMVVAVASQAVAGIVIGGLSSVIPGFSATLKLINQLVSTVKSVQSNQKYAAALHARLAMLQRVLEKIESSTRQSAKDVHQDMAKKIERLNTELESSTAFVREYVDGNALTRGLKIQKFEAAFDDHEQKLTKHVSDLALLVGGNNSLWMDETKSILEEMKKKDDDRKQRLDDLQQQLNAVEDPVTAKRKDVLKSLVMHLSKLIPIEVEVSMCRAGILVFLRLPIPQKKHPLY